MGSPGDRKQHRLRHVPNALTIVRIILVPVFVILLMSHPGDMGWRLAATMVFAFALATDFLDGRIARKYDIISDFGKIWDPLADKAVTGAGFICLSILGELWWWVTVVILLREIGITLLREWLLRRKIVMPANRGGKLKTLIQSFALVVFLLGLDRLPVAVDYIAYLLMGAALALTVVSGVVYLVEAHKAVAQVGKAASRE